MDPLRMVPVATAGSRFEAKLISARLGAEGVVWQLRGSVDGMYPVGAVEVLVPEAEAEQAREILAATALLDDVTEEPSVELGRPASAHPGRLLAAVLVVGVVAFSLVRLLALG